MIVYYVVHKDEEWMHLKEFTNRAEANYYITDVYGLDSANYTIKEVDRDRDLNNVQ